MDTMTASGTGLLQFSKHGADSRAGRTFMRTLFSQFESLSCKKLRCRPGLAERHTDYHFVPSADTAHER
jgi:hypothetical protein